MRSRARIRRKNRALRPRAHGSHARSVIAEPATPETTPAERVTRPDIAAPPAHAAPVEAAHVAGAPIEAAPVAEAPIEAAPVAEAPIEAAPVVEAPIEQELESEESGPSSLSLSSEFFSERGDSFPPLVEDTIEDLEDQEPPSAELVARRARLRRAVGGFVGLIAAGCALAVALGGTGPSPLAQAASAAPPAVTVEDEPREADRDLASPVERGTGAPTEDPAAEDGVKEAPTEKDAEDPEDAATEDEHASPAEDADADTLRRDALRLLNQGHYDEAIATADAAIVADPEHALPYLCKGSALADRGDRTGAIEAYSQCLQRAKRGAVYECGALGGRKESASK